MSSDGCMTIYGHCCTKFLHVLYLCEFLLFEGNLSIIADLPQGGTKAPLVSGDAQGRHTLHTLRSDPWDTMHTLCRGKQSPLQQLYVN